jgi:hypothetical protein
MVQICKGAASFMRAASHGHRGLALQLRREERARRGERTDILVTIPN